jgi:hypothetical protein
MISAITIQTLRETFGHADVRFVCELSRYNEHHLTAETEGKHLR